MLLEGVGNVSRNTVYRLIKKREVHKTMASILHPVRARPGVTLELLHFIEEEMEMKNEKIKKWKNDEWTAVLLQRNISQEFGVNFSAVKDLRPELDWMAEKTWHCQMVRATNQVKQKTYAEQCLASGEQFDDVIFSDECNIKLETNGNITFHRCTVGPESQILEVCVWWWVPLVVRWPI